MRFLRGSLIMVSSVTRFQQPTTHNKGRWGKEVGLVEWTSGRDDLLFFQSVFLPECLPRVTDVSFKLTFSIKHTSILMFPRCMCHFHHAGCGVDFTRNLSALSASFMIVRTIYRCTIVLPAMYISLCSKTCKQLLSILYALYSGGNTVQFDGNETNTLYI